MSSLSLQGAPLSVLSGGNLGTSISHFLSGFKVDSPTSKFPSTVLSMAAPAALLLVLQDWWDLWGKSSCC